jgi:hypothetical protein
MLGEINKIENINNLNNLNNFETKNKSGELFKTNKTHKSTESIDNHQGVNQNYISVKILFKYLCAIICPCNTLKKSYEIYCVNCMEKIFKKTKSMDVMVKKFCEVEQMREILVKKNQELGRDFSLSIYNTIMKLEEEKSVPFSSKIFIL